MLGYSIVSSLYYSRKSRYEIISHLAEEIYFIGYLCTITIIISLAFIYSILELNFPETAILLRSVAIALTTTLIGLVLMNAMKSWAMYSIPSLKELSDSGRVKLLDNSIVGATENINGLKNSAQSMKDHIGSLNKTVLELKGKLTELITPLSNASEEIENFNTKAGKLKDTAKELGKITVKSETINKINKNTEAVAEITTKFTELEKSIEEFSNKLTESSNKAKNFNLDASESTRISKEFSIGVIELQQVLDKFVLLMEKYTAQKTMKEK